MEYQAGSVGRIFYVRFDHGEDVLASLKQLVRDEQVQQCWFHCFGGLASAHVVTGPREPVVPPEPVWREVTDTREVVCTGSIFFDRDEPMVHMHAVMGHHGQTLTGCVRNEATVYLVLEAVLYEMTGMRITRPWYEKGGFNRPRFEGAGG